MRTSPATGDGEGGFGTQFWLGPINTQNTCDDALKTSGPFLLQSLNSIAAQFDLLVVQEITREL
jgi:hypothetical protein